MYKGELAVGEQSVVVNAGETVSSNIHDTSGVDVSSASILYVNTQRLPAGRLLPTSGRSASSMAGLQGF